MKQPRRKLNDWIEGFLRYTENTEPAKTFRLWAAISTIAACLQRKCYLEWGPYVFYPNLYVVLVAPPGYRKGTAIDPALSMLEEINVRLASEAVTREALIRELAESSDSEIVSDGTIVAHSSLTVIAPELAVFLGYDNRQLMSDLCDWYDCRRQWTYRTKTQGTDVIRGVFVNIFGGTTPELIRTSLPIEMSGSGLASRIIFVFEETKKIVALPFLNEPEEALRNMLRFDLELIRSLRGQFKVTQGFIDLWAEWYTEQSKNPPFKDPRLVGYNARRGTHIMKLSMVMSAATSQSMIIGKEDLERAIKYLTITERKMHRVFQGVGKSSNADVTASIMSYIAKQKQVTYSELLERHLSDVDDFMLDKIVSSLDRIGFIRRVVKGSETIIYHKRSLKGSDDDQSRENEETI